MLLAAFALAALLLIVAAALVYSPRKKAVHYEDLAPGADYYLDTSTDTAVVRAGGSFGDASYQQILDDIHSHTDLRSLKTVVCERTPSGCVYNSRLVGDFMPLHLAARREPPLEGPVPHTVFMTANSHACSSKQRRRLLRLVPEDYDFSFYDHAARRALIAEFFEPRFLGAYDACLSEVYRRNIWALCVLYVHGGVFVGPRCKAVPAAVQTRELYFAGFDNCVASAPGNPLLYDILELACANVERRLYGTGASRVCGSELAYEYLERSGYGDWEAVRTRDRDDPRWRDHSAYIDDDKPVCRI